MIIINVGYSLGFLLDVLFHLEKSDFRNNTSLPQTSKGKHFHITELVYARYTARVEFDLLYCKIVSNNLYPLCEEFM